MYVQALSHTGVFFRKKKVLMPSAVLEWEVRRLQNIIPRSFVSTSVYLVESCLTCNGTTLQQTANTTVPSKQGSRRGVENAAEHKGQVESKATMVFKAAFCLGVLLVTKYASFIPLSNQLHFH